MLLMNPQRPPTMDECIQRGLINATEAVALDVAGKLVAAFGHYKAAVEHLEQAYKLAPTEASKREIASKFIPYLERAEVLLKTVPELEEKRKKWEQALGNDR